MDRDGGEAGRDEHDRGSTAHRARARARAQIRSRCVRRACALEVGSQECDPHNKLCSSVSEVCECGLWSLSSALGDLRERLSTRVPFFCPVWPMHVQGLAAHRLVLRSII